jgi:hypothetical protein
MGRGVKSTFLCADIFKVRVWVWEQFWKIITTKYIKIFFLFFKKIIFNLPY